jgi:hypothetical protein
MASLGLKTEKQASFVKLVQEQVSGGADLDIAAKKAAGDVYGDKYKGSKLLKVPVIREELGLDDPAAATRFGNALFRSWERAEFEGIFPDWIEEVGDKTAKAKLKLDFLKAKESKLGDKYITKTERIIQDEGDFSGRSDVEIQFHIFAGRFPTAEEALAIDRKEFDWGALASGTMARRGF